MLASAAAFTAAWASQSVTFFGDLAEQARDVSIALMADDLPQQHLTYPIVFVAIDAETYLSLGRPELTPRHKLGALLESLAAARPTLVVVDIDIGWQAPPEQNLVFTRSLRELAASNVAFYFVRQGHAPAHSGGPAYFRRTPYDGVFDQSQNLHWVSAQAVASGDGVVRKMKSWVVGCQGDVPKYFVNAAVAAAAAVSRVAQERSALPPTTWSCATNSTTVDRSGGQGGAPHELIRYSWRWDGRELLTRQTVGSGSRMRPLLSIMPAHQFFDAGGSDLIAAEFFRESIVVVGASHPDTGDYVLTPLGEMPGAFVLLNHIRGMLDFGPERADFPWLGLAVILLMSLVTALLTLLAATRTMGVIEFLMPLALTVLWWGFLSVFAGSTAYFALAFTQLIAGLSALVARRTAAGGKHIA